MPTLMDAIRGNMSSVPAPGATDETARLADMMKAKSGRAIPGSSSTPKMSNLGEQSANAQSAAQSGAQKQDAAIQTAGVEAGLAAAETSTETKLASISAERAAQKQNFLDRESSLVQELKQGKQEDLLGRNKAKLEQLGFVSRLNSESYVQTLNQTAAELRLEDEHSFRDQLAKDVFGAEMDFLKTVLNYNELLAADANRFEEMIGGMDINVALQIANSKATAANQQAQYTSAGNIASATTSAYADYKKDNPEPKKDKPKVT